MPFFFALKNNNRGIIRLIACLTAAALMSAVTWGSLATLAQKGTPVEIKSRRFPVIVIDAGHGGVDGGAVASDGTVEKSINLFVSLKLERMLQVLGFETVMTRTEDRLISDGDAVTIRQKKSTDLKNRAKLLASYDDAVLISIHQNMFSQSKYYGAQVFFSGNHADSKLLAQSIQTTIVSFLQKDNERQIKMSGSEIFLLYSSEHPAVMVECGFLSNPAELEKLKSGEYQSEIAFSVMCGIIEYINQKESEINA